VSAGAFSLHRSPRLVVYFVVYRFSHFQPMFRKSTSGHG